MGIPAIQHIQDAVALAAGDSPVDFDFTLFIMVVLFLTLMVVFNGTLYRPYLRAREVRDDRIDGAKRDARQMQKTADAVFKEYEDKLSTALREASSQRNQVRDEAKREEGKILATARAEMDAVHKKAQADLDAELKKAETELKKQAQSLSELIVERVLS